jgi:hypothetical protein
MVYILFCYEDYESYIGEVYDTYTKAYDRKKEILADKYDRNDGIQDIEIISKPVLK